MKLAVFLLLAALAFCGLIVVLALQLRYAVTERHLKVTLFGICLRRIRLADIERVSKRQSYRAERWINTLKPSHRTLVIRKRRGWFKDFTITPKNRYVFKAELEQAVASLKTGVEPENSDDSGVSPAVGL